MVVIHIAALIVLVMILMEVKKCSRVSEGYSLGEYYKLRQCRCVPQYDKPTFTRYN
jgi:hypothetical protein